MTIEQQDQLEGLFDEISQFSMIYALSDNRMFSKVNEKLKELRSTFAARMIQIIQPIPQLTLD